MFSSLNGKDLTWATLLGALMLSTMLGLGACSNSSSNSSDDSSSGGEDIGEGEDGGVDPACVNGGTKPNTCAFTVLLYDSGNNLLAPPASSYSYSLGTGWLANEVKSAWTTNPAGAPGTSLLFEYLETDQFVVGASKAPRYLSVAKSNKSNTSDKADCMAVFHKNAPAKYIKLNDSASRYTLSGVTQDTPIQLTLIPFANGGSPCSTPKVALEPTRALAVWISEQTPHDTADCNFTKDFSATEGRTIGACPISSPKNSWAYMKPSSGKNPAHVEYRGSLFHSVQRLHASKEKTKLTIVIDKDVSVDRGLSSGYAKIEVKIGSEDECRKAVESINANGQDAAVLKDCVFANKPVEFYTVLNDKQIIVTGFGRINGYTILNRYKHCKRDTSGGSDACPENKSPTRWDQARWGIDVQLLNLSSSFPSAYSIDVSHITVAWPAYRGVGAVTLNSASTPYAGGLLDGNNYKVKMFDVKQAGGWVDQADGPEIMGEDSFVEYSYIHSNDDAVKISAPGVNYNESTLLHGSAGGAVNIGSYGYNRTVDGSKIDGLYIHRITNNPSGRADGPYSFEATGGVITSRTCPRRPLVDNPGVGKLGDVTINRVYIPTLGLKGAYDPNQISALFSLGVSQSGGFCKFGAEPHPTKFTMGPFSFTNFNIHVDPVSLNYLYSEGKTSTSNVDVTWNMTGKIKFSSSSDKTSVSDVKIYKPKVSDTFYYYMCGQGDGDGGLVLGCYNSKGKGTKSNQTRNNITYSSTGGTPKTVFNNVVQNPFTKP